MYGHKACELSQIEIKADGGGGYGQITGYAATFGNWDSVNETFAPAAFDEHINEFKHNGFVTVEHNWKVLPVATIQDVYKDSTGLRVVGDFHSTPAAQEARTTAAERLQRGKSVSFSLGYEILEDEYTEEGRVLKKARPFEVSLANVPINREAVVHGVKGGGLQAGSLTMDDHQDEVQAALSGFVRRAQGLVELREKSGRKIAEARRQRIRAAIEAFLAGAKDLEELLKETEHADPEEADPETMKKAITAFLIEDARRKELMRHGPLARTY